MKRASLASLVLGARKRNVDVATVLLAPTLAEIADEKRRWVERGCRIVNVSSDRRILTETMRAMAAATRT